ncbi:MAG TPA: PAS domain S-box protein, partial [Candidatus Kapabacteria bacterium]|nr:PAS domain S-box protein [Candidatus Kapabacteria bacterium]
MVWSVLPDGSVEYANPHWFEYSGLSREETDLSWMQVLHPEDRAEFGEWWKATLASQAPNETSVRLRNAKDGAYYWHAMRMVPLREDTGEIAKWHGITTNIDEAIRASERLRFLKEATEELSSSLDYEQTLHRLVHAIVPRLADWCAVDMVVDEGSLRRLAVAHVDPEKIRIAQDIAELYPPTPETSPGTFEMIKNGESVLVSYLTPSLLLASAVDPKHEEMILKLGLESVMAVPLKVEGKVVGIITFAASESHRHFDEEDLAFAEEFAHISSIAIRNSQLYEAAQREIRERKEVERQLLRGEAQFKSLLESNLIGILFSDGEGRIYYANRAFTEMLGYTPEEFRLAAPTRDAVTPPEERYHYREAVEELNKEGVARPYTKRFLHRDGGFVPCLLSTAYLGGDADQVVSFVLNLSDLQESELARQEFEAQYKIIAETASDAIFTIDRESTVEYVNQAVTRIFGWEPDELIGTKLDVIMPEYLRKLHYAGMERYVAGGKKHIDWTGTELTALHKDGREFPVEVSFGEYERDGQRKFVGFVRDITERKHAAEELHRAKEAAEAANEAKDRFLAVLSHELRTPLTPILTTVQALETDESLPKELVPWLEIIERNVQSEARLIDDLLDLTRISKGKLPLAKTEYDIHRIIREVLEMFTADATQKGIRINAELGAKDHCGCVDPGRVKQIMWNLIKNAIKFTPEGGRVSICTSNPDKERLLVEVEDNGIGIDQEIIERIFEPFEQGEQSITRHFGGLGLGLAISKLLAEMHDGRLIASSPGKNKGARMSLELPSLGEGVTISAPPTKPLQRAKGTMRILMVDDHVDTSKVLAMLLLRKGYTAEVRHTIADALEFAKSNDFDVLVSDIGLPDGTGLELIAKLRKLKGHYTFRAIAMTGYGTEQDIQRTKEAGFDKHITKPFEFKDLYD